MGEPALGLPLAQELEFMVPTNMSPASEEAFPCSWAIMQLVMEPRREGEKTSALLAKWLS